MGITNWSIRHSITIFVLILVLGISGFIAYQSLPREAEPDITIPFIMVTTPYIGVAPADIEALVTDPIEEELEQLRDVREITSTSAEGASIIAIEFEPGIDIDDALQKVRDRVDTAQPELPEDAEDPMVNEISFSEFPVLVINISGEVGLMSLKRIAEDTQDRLERINGVLDVVLVGGVEREITVEADPRMLDFYGVTLLELVGVVQAANLNIPGGAVDLGEYKYLVRVPGEFDSVSEIEDIVVRMEDGRPIYVRDVARVVDGLEDETTYSRLDGRQSVSLSITRRAGENIIRITDEAKEIVEEMHEIHGGSVVFTTLNDKSEYIRIQLNELENNIITGLLLVTAVLLFFMGGLRNALFVASAIPLSMLISFLVLAALGVTLNIVVLFSLVLALGMLVDNAIVTVENIYRHATMGKTLVDAAQDGVAEIAWPIIASTATTVFAFLPLLFWPGIMGEFMKFMPLTVIIVLSASLFVALVINPVLCAAFMRVKGVEMADGRPIDELEALPNNLLYRAYGGTLRFAIRHRLLVGILTVATFVGTMMLYGKFNAGGEFFPQVTPERVYVNVTLPDGSNLEASNRIVDQVEAIIAEQPNIEHWVADVGAGNGDQMSFGGDGTAPHRSRITVEFVDLEDQTENVYDTVARIREQITHIPGAEFEVQMEQGGPPQGPPINIEIVGPDYATLAAHADDVMRLVRDVPGLVDLRSDYEAGRPEITVEVDRVEAARVNVSVQDVANTVRSAVNGFTASTFRAEDDEYDIIVRLRETERDSIEDIAALTVINHDGEQIPLTEVARVAVGSGYGSIRHIDGDRVVTVVADVADGFNAIEARTKVEELVRDGMSVTGAYDVRFTGQNQDEEEAGAFLSKALLSGLFLIALVLITQFNSISQPLIILGSVILSLLGVLWVLMARQLPFSMIMTGVGIISLAGVVVNNAIVLIDYTNQLRERGLAANDAVIQAGLVRLRPVLLTAMTTALSLLPTVLGYNLDVMNGTIARGGTSVEMWGPMANAVVSGLIVATFLTLVVVPVMYSAIEGARETASNLWSRISGRRRRVTLADLE